MLLTLLRMPDVPWNDIFIHMDSKNTSYQPEMTERCLKHAHVYHTSQRISVTWAGISITKAEFATLKADVAHGPYQHYHLISGMDFPIQKTENIRAFLRRIRTKSSFTLWQGLSARNLMTGCIITTCFRIITPRENAGFAERPHRGHNTSRA